MKSKRIQKANDFKDQLRTKVAENFKFDLNSHIPNPEPELNGQANFEVIVVRRCGSFKIKERALEILETLKKGKGVRIEGKGKLAEKAVNLLELVKELGSLESGEYSIGLLEGSEAGLKIAIARKR